MYLPVLDSCCHVDRHYLRSGAIERGAWDLWLAAMIMIPICCFVIEPAYANPIPSIVTVIFMVVGVTAFYAALGLVGRYFSYRRMMKELGGGVYRIPYLSYITVVDDSFRNRRVVFAYGNEDDFQHPWKPVLGEVFRYGSPFLSPERRRAYTYELVPGRRIITKYGFEVEIVGVDLDSVFGKKVLNIRFLGLRRFGLLIRP